MNPADTAAVRPEQRLLDKLLREKYEPIAIIGMGHRFPGGNDSPAGFAEFLRAGRCGTGPIPPDRWDVAGLATTDAKTPGKIRTEGGGFLEGIDQFDARFFNIAPKEANYIDPQQRLILECAWTALEHANIDPHSLKDSESGVYIGIACVDYTLEVEALPYEQLDGHIGTGTSHSSVAGRLSFFLGLRGPCVALDTACSSSLVSLHLAVQGLRRGECSLALAGGVNAVHHPRHHIIFTQANMLAADGRCKTFDERADGYGRSEGCGVLVLKRLSDALRDGDNVLALVRGSAIAQDGESAGLTVPSGSAQELVMRRAMESAMLAPADIQYVEAHGTGTPLGDPIEIAGIHGVFGASHGPDAPLLVGSVKTNLGHMEAAAGVGGLVKTVLQLQAGEIFPHLHFETPSSRIPWERYAITVPTETRPWPGKTRRALVNSFGFSGIIASVLLEQAPVRAASPAAVDAAPDAAAEPQLFTLSAKSRSALLALVQQYRAALPGRPAAPTVAAASLAALCRATRGSRSHFAHRIAGVVRSWDELEQWLARSEATLQDGAAADAASARQAPRVAWLFTGQGAQYPGMGLSLYRRFPVFRQEVDALDALFAPLLQRSIRALMFGEDADAAQLLGQTAFTQPALFTLELAAARLWQSFGVQPAVLVGHSIGELAAATVAGVFSVADAVKIVAERGRLMQSVSRPGGMLAVSAAPQQVAPLLRGQADVVVAAFNAPTQCVISGSLDGLEAVGATLKAKGLASKPLPVSHAFHSPLMAEVFPAFRAAFEGVTLNEPALTVMSNVTGATATARELRNPDYWVRHIGEPVRFAAGMQGVAARGKHMFLELGPAPVLTALGRQCVDAAEHGWAASLKSGEAGTAALLDALAQLYLAGASIQWRAVDAGQPRPQLALPHYPFERKRHWLPVAQRHAQPAAGPAAAGHPLLGQAEAAGADGVVRFSQRLSARQPAYLADHVVMGQVIFPGAGYVELLLSAQDALFGETGREIRDLAIHEALILRDDAFCRLSTTLTPRADGGHDVRITSLQEGVTGAVERQHASAVLAAWGDAAAPDTLEDSLRAAFGRVDTPPRSRREAEQLYADYQAMGLFYGPAFQQLQAVEILDDARVVGTLAAAPAGPELMPPALLDAAFQSMAGLLDTETTYLPVGFERLRLGKKPRGPVRCLVKLTRGVPGEDPELRFDLLLLEPAQGPAGGRVVFSVAGLTLKQASSGAARRLVHGVRWLKRSLPQSAHRPASARQVALVGLAPARVAALQALAPEGALVLHGVESAEALAAALRRHAEVTDVAWAWQPQPALQGLARLQAESEANYRALLVLAQGLEREFYDRKLRLWLLTSGALSLPGDAPRGSDDSLAAASAWGFGAVWLNEQPKLRVTLLDLDPAAADDLAPLLQEWGPVDSAAETRIAWRDGQRHVQRVVAPREAGPSNFRLVVRDPGGFANVLPEAIPDAPPGPGEVTVEMRSAGLNFKDVLNALGLLKQHADQTGQAYKPLPLGFEGAGVVTVAGEGSGYAAGDEVIVNHLGCMQRRVTLPALALVRKPPALSFTQAAGLPAAYVTAAYALQTLAGLRAGDKVLIHAAAGGVGQAAVQLALQAGAEVFATASPRKWPLLRSQGVKHLMNSRTLDFAAEIERLTAGTGVDVVLNSLNKEHIPASLGALARGGRFVELGKVGVWSPDEVKALRPDVAYHNFDLSEFDPQALLQLNHELLSRVVAEVEAGRLPALPTTVYGMDEVEEAFAVLSRGANTGKLVLRFDEPAPPPPTARAIDPEAVYLVTGGFGALGEWTARTLVAMGVRHLALVARTLPDTAALEQLRQRLGPLQGWLPLQADVAEAADVARLQQALAATGRPLGAVVHAAGVLRDKPVLAQDWAGIEAVLRPKVYGGWLLHRMAAALPGNAMLVGFSSVAAVVGAAGQANYAAANSFLDALAHWRAAQGQPSLSVNWGPFAEVGMAARLESAQVQAVEGKGFKFIRPREGMRQLRSLWTSATVQAIVGEVDWGRVASAQSAGAALYTQVAGEAQAGPAARLDVEALAELPRAERLSRLNALVRGCIARLLHFDSPDDIAPDTPFAEVGLDSLEGVELANALEEALQMPLPGSIIFDAPAIPLLTEFLANALEQRAAGRTAAASDTVPSEAPA